MGYEAEMPGRRVSVEELQMICCRYYTASKFVQGKQVVLEVGCGAGLGLGYLAKKAKKVIGGDYVEENIRCAQRHYGERVELLLLDAHSLPFRDNCFDVIMSMEVIFYLRHIDKFLEECRRVLKRGGHLIICLPNKDCPGFLRSKLSYKYYSVPELFALLDQHQFDAELFGTFPIPKGSEGLQRAQATVVNGVSKALDWMPKGKEVKEFLNKSIPSHKTVLKAELEDEDMKILENIQLVPLPCSSPNFRYKILYEIANARDSEMRTNK